MSIMGIHLQFIAGEVKGNLKYLGIFREKNRCATL